MPKTKEQTIVEAIMLSHARAIQQSRQLEDNCLGITTLFDFIKSYIKVDPNFLYFTPKDKITKEENCLLLLLQCLDERNDKREVLIEELHDKLFELIEEKS